MNFVFARSLALVSVIFLLSACGGGSSSSSGGGQTNVVTFCIQTMEGRSSVGLPNTTYTNTCDFVVNLGAGVGGILLRATLQPGQSVSDTSRGLDFFACRFPTQPVDRDPLADIDFDCE